MLDVTIDSLYFCALLCLLSFALFADKKKSNKIAQKCGITVSKRGCGEVCYFAFEKCLTNFAACIIIAKVYSFFLYTKGAVTMDKKIEVSLLLDFYGELLKPGVRETVDLYCNDDLSLAEVADQCGITRQGVHDSIKRGEAQLYAFEKKLGLFKRFRELEAGLDDIASAARQIAAQSTDTRTRALAMQIADKAGALKE